MKKLLVLDGNSILNRAFYGVKPLNTSAGLPTNAVYGFYNILNRLLADEAPDACAVAFDLKAPTFRHKAFEGYKATRKPMPQELAVQLPLVKELLDALGIRRLEAEGFEADDILGTQAAACVHQGDACVIATGDRDSLQLVSPSVTVLLAATRGGRPETERYDEAKISEKYGVSPKQLIEVKALMGDASDNIPGVSGVGEKTALDLIRRFGGVERIYGSLDSLDIRDSLREKLRAGRQSAAMSRELAEIHTDAPVDTGAGALLIGKRDDAALYRLLKKLEFNSVLQKLGLSAPAGEQQGEAGSPGKLPLQAVQRPADLLRKLGAAGQADFCCIFSGSSLDAVCFSLADGFYAVLRESSEDYESFLKEFFTDASLPKCTHGVKEAAAWCLGSGYTLAGECFDTMLAAYLLDPLAPSYELSRLCGDLGLYPPEPEAPFGMLEDVTRCARDAASAGLFAAEAKKRLEQNGQHALYYDIELPLAFVLANMEQAGFQVDVKGIEAYGRQLEGRLRELAGEIYGHVGYEFNVNSTKQLGEALFVKLGLPARKKTKTGYSTNVDVLESLRGHHPIIELLLEYRKIAKLISTYTEGLLKVVAPDGRIHSSFNQVETRTGRISSTEPNLQNIPVRTEIGRELRKFFVAREGCVLVDADYSQIELRILAHVANDEAMLDAFNRHADIHAITASQVFKMPLEMVTPLMRSRAKAVNFGIVYGISAFSLSQDIGVSVKEADHYIKGYLETFSGVRQYREDVVALAKKQGYVETLSGRRRMLPELASSNFNLRSFGERVALNTPIQGTAADIIKIAMVRVFRRLKKEGLRSRLILQVHDELILEAPEEEAQAASRIVEEEMEHAMALRVKLEADVHTGRTWYDAKNG